MQNDKSEFIDVPCMVCYLFLTEQEHWYTLFSQGRSVFCEFISTHLMGGKKMQPV